MTIRHVVSGFLMAALLAAGAFAQVTACPLPDPLPPSSSIPMDNIEDNYVLQEMDPQHAIETAFNFIFAANPFAHRVEIFSRNPLDPVLVCPTAQGPVSARFRPGTFELWVVCHISNCISVIDFGVLDIKETIRLSAGPQSLVFDASGSKAYVACSIGRTVDVIHCATYTRDVAIDIAGKRPCDLTIAGNRLYVVPRNSGNGTGPLESPGSNFPLVVDYSQLVANGIIPLPDNDIFAIDILAGSATQNQVIDAETIHGVGTMLFDVEVNPLDANELWVANTDALNTTEGEQNFIDGHLVDNRVSIVDLSTGTAAHVPLDGLTQPGAQPTGLAFDAANQRCYVFCEASDRIWAIDVASAAPLGYWDCPAPAGSGKRSMPHDGEVLGTDLIVYFRGTNRIAKIPTSTPLGGVGPTDEEPMWHPLTDRHQQGLGILNNADLSLSGDAACSACHAFSDQDSLVWDLSGVLDPQGTPNPLFYVDLKGPMVTQSLRALRATAPYHWRGERQDIQSFNIAFQELLDGSQIPDDDMDKVAEYLDLLVYPANHRQPEDRVYTTEQRAGFVGYAQMPALAGGQSCNDCHALPLGTNGEVMKDFGVGFPKSFVVPQLFNIRDKELGLHDLGTFNGGAFSFAAGLAPETGAGLGHAGVVETLHRFDADIGVVTPCQADDIHEFISAMDTGSAPATAWAAQLKWTNGAVQNSEHLNYIMSQADAGNCGAYLVGYVLLGGTPLHVKFFYQGNDMWNPERLGWAPVPTSIIELFVNDPADIARFSVIGTHKGESLRAGWDLDYDGLANLDEAPLGTDPDDPDSDDDGFPDGYEVTHAMNPLVADPPGSAPDVTAPAVTDVSLVYLNTNTIKIDMKTDEPCRLTVSWIGKRGPESLDLPQFGMWDVDFQAVIVQLEASTAYDIDITPTDPNGNSPAAPHTVTYTTDANVNGKLFVQDITMVTTLIGIDPITGATTHTIDSTVTVRDELGNPVVGSDVNATFHFDDGTGLSTPYPNEQLTTDAAGQVTFTGSFTAPAGTVNRKVWCVVTDVSTPAAMTNAGYVEAMDVESVDCLAF